VNGEHKMQLMHGLDELEAQGQMTWIEAEAQHGWAAVPGDVVDALSRDGFEECKGETTTSRQKNLQPAGGMWQGVDPGTGSSSLERDPYTDDGGES
jgi:hypothetical protein